MCFNSLEATKLILSEIVTCLDKTKGTGPSTDLYASAIQSALQQPPQPPPQLHYQSQHQHAHQQQQAYQSTAASSNYPSNAFDVPQNTRDNLFEVIS